jgi:hypothetical protein
MKDEYITRALEMASAASKGRVTMQVIEDVIMSEFAEEFDRDMRENARANLRRRIVAVMTRTFLDSLSEEDRPDPILPGLPAPRFLAVPRGAAPTEYVRFGALTKSDLAAAIAERRLQIDHDTARVDDLQRKTDILAPYMPHEFTTVDEAKATMRAERAAVVIAFPEAAGNKPRNEPTP